MDLILQGGTVVTATETYEADIGVKDGRIAAIGEALGASGAKVIDVEGCFVIPGGIDVHTHLDTPDFGATTADDYATGTVAAACGGTTTIVDFCRQEHGESLGQAIERWHRKAAGKAAIDYGFHIIVTDYTDATAAELRSLPEAGISSFKLFMAYRGASMVDDRALIGAMDCARRGDALVMVHAENGDAADFLRDRYAREGCLSPRYHALSRPARVEAEATARAIALSEIVDAPLYIVHLTCLEALQEVRRARTRGVKVLAETCTHYLYTTADDLDREGFEGAKFVFTPPPRTRSDQKVLWDALSSGELQVVSSDHAPWNFEKHKSLGRDDFRLIPNGAPGIEERLIMLFQGVVAGRLTLNRFVDLTSTSPARIFGMYPEKGTIAVGSDADLVVWDPTAEATIAQAKLHHAVDYTLYEGERVCGMPRSVFLRGRSIVADGVFTGAAGSGRFIRRRGPRAQSRHGVSHLIPKDISADLENLPRGDVNR